MYEQHIDFTTRDDILHAILFSEGSAPCSIAQLRPISSPDHVMIYADFALPAGLPFDDGTLSSIVIDVLVPEWPLLPTEGLA